MTSRNKSLLGFLLPVSLVSVPFAFSARFAIAFALCALFFANFPLFKVCALWRLLATGRTFVSKHVQASTTVR